MSPRTTWVALGLALALVLGVMGWVTVTLLGLDHSRIRTEREAVVEEQTRLSLWRIDSTTTPILSREVAALDAASAATPSGQLPVPPPGVVLRFALTRDSMVALTGHDAERLAQLERDLVVDDLFARLAQPNAVTLTTATDAKLDGREADEIGRAIEQRDDTPYALKTQAVRNEDEWSRRKANVEDNLIAYQTLSNSLRSDGSADKGGLGSAIDETSVVAERPEPNPGGPGLYRGARTPAAFDATTVIEPLWVGEHLLLLRRAGDDRIEGSWLDWPALQTILLAQVIDLLPDAQLVPTPAATPDDMERMLATLPARLEPGTTIPPPPGWSPLRASLLAGWLIVLGALGAMIVLVRVSLALSERRAAFVSAVTHELRTPLTTFRMYTEMLAEGMVDHKRDHYLATLRREADRLSGLVENVLAYARIESDRSSSHTEVVSLGLLLDRVEDRLRERCQAANMRLELDTADAKRELPLRTDPAAVEQILFNLVDNAAKYAPSEEDPRIHVSVELQGRRMALHVRDFGPGIDAAEAARIFEPFTKARVDAAGTKPGVGLGLALSRRLARQMGGNLALVPCAKGADFVLTLPTARG